MLHGYNNLDIMPLGQEGGAKGKGGEGRGEEGKSKNRNLNYRLATYEVMSVSKFTVKISKYVVIDNTN